MMDFVLYLVLGLIIVWLLARVFLSGADHSQFDEPRGANVTERASPEHKELVRRLDELTAELQSLPFKDRNVRLRELMDDGLLGATVDAEGLGVTVEPADVGGVPGEGRDRADEQRRHGRGRENARSFHG